MAQHFPHSENTQTLPLPNKKDLVKKFCQLELKNKIGMCKICFAVIEFKGGSNPINPVFAHLSKYHKQQIYSLRPQKVRFATGDLNIQDQDSESENQKAEERGKRPRNKESYNDDESEDESDQENQNSDQDDQHKNIGKKNQEQEDFKRPHMFTLWNYALYDQKTMMATCKFCRASFLTENGSSNELKFHLETKHSIIIEDEFIFPSSNKNISSQTSKNKNDSSLEKIAWSYFNRDSFSRAICKICKLTKIYKSQADLQNILLHIKQVHDEPMLNDWRQKHQVKVDKKNISRSQRSRDQPTNGQILENHDLIKDISGPADIQSKLKTNLDEKLLYDKQKMLALCKLCDCVFSTKIFGLDNFIKHLELHHKICQTKFKNSKIILQTVFQDDEEEIHTFLKDNLMNKSFAVSNRTNKQRKGPNIFLESPQKKVLNQQQNGIGRIERNLMKIAKSLEGTLQGCSDEYLEYLSAIKRQHNFQILSFSQQTQAQFYLLAKMAEAANLPSYQRQISCWQFCHLPKIHSIIYMVGHNQNLRPEILGIAIITIENTGSYENLFKTFFEIVNFMPSQIFVCGSQKLKQEIEHIIDQKIGCELEKKSVQKRQIVNSINSKILKTNLPEKINQFLKQFLKFYCQQERKSNKELFLGFIFTEAFFHQMRMMIPQKFELYEKIHDFPQYCLKSLNSRKPQRNLSEINQIVFQACIIKSLRNSEMAAIQKIVSREVFEKISLSFTYAVLKLKYIEKNQGLFLCFQKDDQQTANKVTEYYVAYNRDMNCWRCDCGIQTITGIPCPHLLRVFLSTGIHMGKYIDECWIKRKKEEQMMCCDLKNEQSGIDEQLLKILREYKDFEQLLWI